MTSSNPDALSLTQALPLMEERLSRGQTVSFLPHGTSMLPLIRSDLDRITLAPLPKTLRRYDLPLYRRENGQFVLHRIVSSGEPYTMCGDNQVYPETGIRREQMIGIVTEFSRNGRKFSVTHPLYRLYCILWCGSRPLRKILRRIRSRITRLLHCS